jgi:hypothetical protein
LNGPIGLLKRSDTTLPFMVYRVGGEKMSLGKYTLSVDPKGAGTFEQTAFDVVKC